jgi:hypothetical protein
MSATLPPRVVLVTRPTWYEQLLERHGTHDQAKFFLAQRGQRLDDVEQQHAEFAAALHTVLGAIPRAWRRTRIERDDLDRFLFEPDDVVIALGQDGLVANVAKYLQGQPVLGVNPSPRHYEGVLVTLPPEATADLLPAVVAGKAACDERTMAAAELDDGQQLLALNELFVGHASHQSARYEARWGRTRELQSSSGVIVSTGTGGTGWARSVLRQRRCELELPAPDEPRLAFFVREAWPSRQTGTQISEGTIVGGEALELVSRMNEGGVIFGDGIEEDRLEFGWGRHVALGLSPERLRLVRG